MFTFNEVKEICPNIMEMPGAINGFGLLQAVQHYPEVGAGKTMSFNFLHFTMQEFLAAYFVSTLSNGEQLSLIRNTFWNAHYTFMWMMYAGTVGIDGEVFLKFIETLDNVQKDKVTCVHLLQCCSEAKTNQIPNKISSVFDNKIKFCNMAIHPFTFWSIISFMWKCDVNTQYSALEFDQCFLDSNQMNLLHHFVVNNPEKISTLEHVNLRGSDVSPWRVFCAVIRYSLVHNLTLCGGHSFNDNHAGELATSLSVNSTLNSLTLINCTELHSIKKVLENAETSLKELNFPWKK